MPYGYKEGSWAVGLLLYTTNGKFGPDKATALGPDAEPDPEPEPEPDPEPDCEAEATTAPRIL